MDASKSLGNHHATTQIAGSDGGMLAARALSIIFAGDDRMRSRRSAFEGALMVSWVDIFEYELADLGNVTAIRQYPRTGRHDLIGRNVITDCQKNRHLQALRESIEGRQSLDVGSFHQLHLSCFLFRQWRDKHLFVQSMLFGELHLRVRNVQFT